MKIYKPARIPVWEKIKLENRKHRLIKLAVVGLVSLIIINLLIKLPGIYRDLNNPFPKDPKDTGTTNSIDTAVRTNYLLIVFDKKRLIDISVATYEPTDKRLTVLLFNLPENKKLRLSTNKVFRLGGAKDVEKYLSIDMGIIFDRYLAFEHSDFQFDKNSILATHKKIKSTLALFEIFSFKSNFDQILKTNLSVSEMLSLFWDIRSSKLEEKDIIQDAASDLEVEEADRSINNLFFDRMIIKEASTVTIRNASGVDGLGSTLGNIVTNLGATVVTIDSTEELSENNFFIVENKKSNLEKRLSALLNFKERKIKENDDFSGDILIILGKDATKKLTLP